MGSFQMAGFVNDPLEKTNNGLIVERPRIHLLESFKDGLLPAGVVDGKMELFFELADPYGKCRTLVEDAQQLLVEGVDPLSDVMNIQFPAPRWQGFYG